MRDNLNRLNRWLFASAGLALIASVAFADDRALLYSQTAAPPNVLVLVSDTETMATCIPGQPVVNGMTCPASGFTLGAPMSFGIGDGPSSKMGIAKSAIATIIRTYPTTFNWGLSAATVSRQNLANSPKKRYIFQAKTDGGFGATNWYYQPAGTWLNFGPKVGTSTTVTYGTGGAARTYQVTPIGGAPSGSYSQATMMGAESWVQNSAGDLYHQPYLLGTDASTSTRTLITNPTANGSAAKQEMLVTFSSTTASSGDPLRILQCSVDCNPSDALFDGQYTRVTKTVVQCTGSAPCDPKTASAVASTTIDFIVPPGFCRESADASCLYPMVYRYGQTGEEIGWTNYVETNMGSNQSGWIVQSNNNPNPMVQVPHPYAPWRSYGGQVPLSGSINYVQSSNPCILRSMRPAASLVDNGTLAENDHFPIFNPATDPTCATGNCLTQCDKELDGLFANGMFPNGGQNEIVPVVYPQSGNGTKTPMINMLTNVYQYFNGGNSGCNTAGCGVDGFGGGVRADDPFSGCRHDYVILITDSYNLSTGQFHFGSSGDPTTQLKSINVPVFVIGFAVASGSAGLNLCTLKSGTTGNMGQCIADFTGATLYQGTSVTREGYYQATDASSLATALNSILNSLNEANRDFATATIPSVSSTSEGVAYLSQFNPQNNRSVWSGHLRAYFLNPTTGLIQANAQGLPDPTKFVFGSGSTGPSGSLIWDGGSTGNDTPGVFGLLDSSRNVTPTSLLTSNPGPGGTWSDSTHDQATGSSVGRNIIFGVRPGDSGCTSTTYQCFFQMPVGNLASTPPTAPSTLPTWWNNVRDSSTYAGIPAALPTQTGNEAANNRDNALQNSFSFVRGNRDPVVENLKLSGKFDATHTTCSSLVSDPDSPCYYGDILGDIFHSNPVVVSFPNNFRYYFAQDPGAANFGTYADRGGSCTFAGQTMNCSSYQLFFLKHAHRRKVLYAGADDGLMHAFDIGVYNGDLSSYTSGGTTIQPFLGHYDLGSGREIFGYAPLAGMNKLYQLAHTTSQDWTIDGPPAADDVYMDVTRVGGTPEGVAPSGAGADSDVAGANPASTSHAWRSVLVGIEREGGLITAGGGIASGVSGNGGSVFALDISDPDQINHMAQTDTGGHTGVPECVVSDFIPGSTAIPSGCDAPYPRVLWELRDDQSVSSTTPQPAEKLLTGEALTQDLGMTWSRPVIGRVKITVGTTPRDFFVAMFGGGYDHTSSSIASANAAGNTGNFLYMVDIETGKIIYKKNLGLWNSGASGTNTAGNLPAGLPGEPAVVDINGDGYMDRLYIGDTQGRVWKVDLTATATMVSNRVQASDWNPTLMFDEYASAVPPLGSVRQPIFARPSVFLINTNASGVARLGVAFGTGDRDDMPVLSDTHPNYFVVLVDDPSISYPLFLSSLTQASLVANNCTTTNCLNANGYYLTLPSTATGAQLVNTNSLVFNQAIFFDTFLHTTTPGNCNQVGEAFFYSLNYLTGESLYTDSSGNVVPYQTGGSGVEVGSDPIAYQDVNSWVVSATDNTSAHNMGGGRPPAVNIKSWKEQ